MKEDRMITVKSQFVQYLLTAGTLFLVVGALSMIWPIILGVFPGVLLLFQSCCAEPEIAVLSLDQDLSIAFASVKRPSLAAILS
jgi:hypothetical protein